MSYVIKTVLSNSRRPERGQVTIPFPIPADQYDRTIDMFQAMELGGPVNRDCRVDVVDSHYSVLGALEGKLVNVDELDYLAKRLDGFLCWRGQPVPGYGPQAGNGRHQGLHQFDILLPAGHGYHRLFQFGGRRAQPLSDCERRHRQDGGAGKPGWRRNRLSADRWRRRNS